MKWLARLKAETSNTTQATNATTFPNVAFVAPTAEVSLKNQQHPPAQQSQPALHPVQCTEKAANATNTPNVAFVAPPPSTKLTAVGQANSDLWCWPHSSAMNTQEIATFSVRLEQFSRKGVSLAEAEFLADRLVLRDRDEDDRQLCLECQHLQGDVGSWRCSNAHAARMAVGIANAPLPVGMTQQLQRCPGFRADQSSAGGTI